MKKKYILKKGNTIGKPGLPNGKLVAKKGDVEIIETHVKLLERNMFHLIAKGTVKPVGELSVQEKKALAIFESATKKATADKKKAAKEAEKVKAAQEKADKEKEEARIAKEKADALKNQNN
ncbi:MAG: hypothetical protein KAJ19_05605 [Gammaproteobacteria bacterium]|nr:hypothetical protein [Gammaproteobacteria bacterium]